MPRLAVIAALATLSVAAPAHATPEHAEIAFAHGGGIWASRADGSERRLLVAGKSLSQPAWSPDGSKLAFASAGDEASRLMLLDGGQARAITPLRRGVYDSSPAWSPDGAALVHGRFRLTERGLRSWIVLHDMTTGAERALVAQRADRRLTSVALPSWSPDGSTIVYTRTALGGGNSFRPSIHTIPAAGGEPRVLIRDAHSPAWSPDGSRLAFASVRDRNGRHCGAHDCHYNGEIYTAAADGTDLARLTRNPGDDHGPAWSPDGSRILFTSDRNVPGGDSDEVYSSAPDGSCLTWVTNGTPASADAAWRPGTGSRFDPGSCDPAARAARLDPPRLPRVPGGLWLGPRHDGLLPSRSRRDFVAYDDCQRFAGCPETVMLVAEPACRRRSFRGLEGNAYRFLRIRGALVAYYSRLAGVRVLSGDAVTTIFLERGGDLRDVRRIVRHLRRYGAQSPPRRLAPPRIPRSLEPGPGPFRRALRAFGAYRHSRC